MKNCGKVFEKEIRKQFDDLRDVSVDRINDNVGYAGAYNIADLIVYRKPYKYYIELKSTKGTSFPFDRVNLRALTDMQYASLVTGVDCYFIIWFIDLDRTIAINARELYNQIHVHNRKSIGTKSFQHFDFIEVQGEKKRKYYKYNLIELLDEFDKETRRNG